MTAQSAMKDVENGKSPVRDLDEDSLFGSPPPSPVLRGRSPSPGLALPSTDNATKNVGTIALPGSQHHSELPVNPLALSLSHGASAQPTPRPPAIAIRPDTRPASPASTTDSPGSSRASSAAPRPKAKTKSTKKRPPSPRPPPPEIPLPDPSEPIPANFLRNQTALLGRAGLVAGIKPKKLATNLHSRGAKASNPIVIPDNEAGSRETQKMVERPILSRISATEKQGVCQVDSSLLPLPSNREVVALLSRQKDFFVTLESILKLVATGAKAPPTQQPSFRSSIPAFRQSQPTRALFTAQPALKRRKLDRVPAGAVDWDVPYPFAQGEGPAEYRENWGRERLKQLIGQLTSMIKDATRKIAIRKFLKEQEAKKVVQANTTTLRPPKEPLHAPSDSPNVPPPTGTLQEHIPLPSRNEDEQPGHVLNSAQPAAPQPYTAFDQLISSLVSATPGNAVDSTAAPPSTLPSVPSLSDFDFATAASPAPLTSDDLENWLNILQTFPANGLDPNQIPNTPISTEEDFGFIDSILDFDSGAYNQPTTSTAESSLEELLVQAGATRQTGSDGMIIDPALLAISGPQAMAQTPSVYASPSPIPSTASSGTADSMDLATPNSATWERSLPDVHIVGDSRLGEEYYGSGSNSGGLSAQGALMVVGDGMANPDDAAYKKSVETGMRTEETAAPAPPRSINAPSAPAVLQHTSLILSGSQTRALQLNKKALNKADILRRANERLKKIDDEIIMAKTQLWETTIEQSILIHMTREYNNRANSSTK